MTATGGECRRVLRLWPVEDAECLGRVLREDCRVESYRLDPGGWLQLRYDLRRTGYRRIRAALAAAGIRARGRFHDTLSAALIGLAEDNLRQQQRRLAPWTGVLQRAYVSFHVEPSPRTAPRHHWRRRLCADRGAAASARESG